MANLMKQKLIYNNSHTLHCFNPFLGVNSPNQANTSCIPSSYKRRKDRCSKRLSSQLFGWDIGNLMKQIKYMKCHTMHYHHPFIGWHATYQTKTSNIMKGSKDFQLKFSVECDQSNEKKTQLKFPPLIPMPKISKTFENFHTYETTRYS